MDLEIGAGTVLGLLGHNGAGKTTMVRILTTLLKPTSGHASVCGFDVQREPEQVRRSLSLAGQQATLDELLSGTENLVLLGMLLGLSRRAAKAKAAELLERFGLSESAKRVVGTYSGGMRRRLDLAACLLVPRPVVLLDEPTTGLDPASRLEVHEAIRELVDEGTALLLTTQYLEEADKLADRIVVLARGRLVAEGTPGQMKDSVGGRRVEAVLADGEDLHAAALALGDAAIDDRTRTVSTAAPNGTEDLHARWRRCGASTVVEAALKRPTLDDAFLALAGEADGAEAAEEARGVTMSAVASTRETLLLAERSLRHIPRIPEKLADATIMPIVFIFTFAYVFGSAITIPGGGSYREYLLGGMFAQGAIQPLQGLAVGVAEDVRTGIVDRLRALPIGRAAFLTGRNLADLCERVLGSIVFIPLALIVGWRVHTGVGDFIAAFFLIQLLAFSFSWIGTWVGLIARSGEGAQQMLFIVIFPLMFVSGSSSRPRACRPCCAGSPSGTR